jgi:hypothetical protein
MRTALFGLHISVLCELLEFRIGEFRRHEQSSVPGVAHVQKLPYSIGQVLQLDLG